MRVKNIAIWPILLVLGTCPLPSFAQEQQSPEITEHQVFVNTTGLNEGILKNLTACGLGVSFDDPTNIEYMPNPRIQWDEPNKLTISADKFVNSPASSVTYNNYSLSGTISVTNGAIGFITQSVQPSGVNDCIPRSMAQSISEHLTLRITPSQYNTWEDEPKNLKCLEIQDSRLMFVYDRKGAGNVVPRPYGLCNDILQGAGSSSAAELSLNELHEALRIPIENPIPSITTMNGAVQRVLSIILTVAIPIMALMIIWSGFLIATARGDEEKLMKGKQAFMAAIIGGFFILGAWILGEWIGSAVKNIRN